MNDFDYDCLQRKRLAQQAKYKKSGAKSRKCSLTTDYMTNKQWKERNGAVMTLKPNEPMTWAQFKELSDTLQTDYIRYLADTYNANMRSISEMFGVSRNTVARYFEESGINIKFRTGCSMNKEQREAWAKFLFGENNTTVTEDMYQPTEPVPQCTEPTADVSQNSMRMTSFSLSFCGKIDVNSIANSLLHILGQDAIGEVQITCSLAKTIS